MILQSLNQLFERLARDVKYDLPRPGSSVQDITFEIVLNPNGTLIGIHDARTGTKAKRVQVPGEGKSPGGVTRTSAPKKAGVLWNDLSFMTGIEISDPPKANRMKFEAFRDNHLKLREKIGDPAFTAVCVFLSQWDPDEELHRADQCKVFAKTGFGVFRIAEGKNCYVHQLPQIEACLHGDPEPSTTESLASIQCLISGDFFHHDEIAPTHKPQIKGVGKNRTLLVSFNDSAYCSYGKEQSYNAPISKKAVFNYCNALNALLSGPQSHRHRISIGSATTVFWTERETTTEKAFAAFFSGHAEIREENEGAIKQDPILHQRLEAFLKLLRRGSAINFDDLGDDPNTKFFILGLSDNVTRLSVRFWHVGTLREMIERLRDHFSCLAIARSFDNEPEFPSAIRLLDQTAPFRNGKSDRKAISPLLSGQLMLAILEGTPYPMALVQGVLNRIRANEPINYLKASILKAYITRNRQIAMTEELDPTRTEPAYHLGRLFAVYETAQKHAHDWKLERTIRETMYSAASTTPLSVFGRLERLHHHHTAKKSHPPGSSASYAAIVEEISQHFKGQSTVYPAVLDIVQQSLFAVGYYHQLHAFRSLNNPKTPTI